MKKRVIARLFIKAGSVGEFMKQANVMIDTTRKEKGNIFYSLFQDVHNSGEFVFYEEYADESALDIHFKSEYLANFRKRTASMHSKPPSVEVV
jgi:quinol monooxygenase YgiN